MGVHHAREWPAAEHLSSSPTTCSRATARTCANHGARDRRDERYRPGGEPGRVQRLARGASVPEDHATARDSGDRRKNCRAAPGDARPSTARLLAAQRRRGPQPQLRGLLGRAGRERGPATTPTAARARRRSRRPGRCATWSRAGRSPTSSRTTPTPPRPAASGRGGGGLPVDEPLYRELGRRMTEPTATRTSRRSSCTTPPARRRTGRTGRPAGSASRSRSATRTSIRSSPRRS